MIVTERQYQRVIEEIEGGLPRASLIQAWRERLNTGLQAPSINTRSIGAVGVREWLSEWAVWCFENTDDPELWAMAKELPSKPFDFESGKLVYFIRSGDTNRVKIGLAFDVKERMKGLQGACPDELNCIVSVPGGKRLEHELHKVLVSGRLRGEWFNMTAPIAALIESLLRTVALIEKDDLDNFLRDR